MEEELKKLYLIEKSNKINKNRREREQKRKKLRREKVESELNLFRNIFGGKVFEFSSCAEWN